MGPRCGCGALRKSSAAEVCGQILLCGHTQPPLSLAPERGSEELGHALVCYVLCTWSAERSLEDSRKLVPWVGRIIDTTLSIWMGDINDDFGLVRHETGQGRLQSTRRFGDEARLTGHGTRLQPRGNTGASRSFATVGQQAAG